MHAWWWWWWWFVLYANSNISRLTVTVFCQVQRLEWYPQLQATPALDTYLTVDAFPESNLSNNRIRISSINSVISLPWREMIPLPNLRLAEQPRSLDCCLRGRRLILLGITSLRCRVKSLSQKRMLLASLQHTLETVHQQSAEVVVIKQLELCCSLFSPIDVA